MLPGDYIAMRMTGNVNTTLSGISEGIMWDYKNKGLAEFLFDYYDLDTSLIPEIVPTFSNQGNLTPLCSKELGLHTDIIVSYRAGDQPNNAYSLNVLNPGEIAATAGTSGVVYGISDSIKCDPKSRVNIFAHINHEALKPRLGVLLCINGTGILNSWIRKNAFSPDVSYLQMNQMAESVPVGSEGLRVIPFGNGAERILENNSPGCSFNNINFNIHSISHIVRAIQEGIVFSFRYGLEIMKNIDVNPKIIRAGNSNMFLSKIFRQTFADSISANIELYDTDGALGAARGAGVGAGIFSNNSEAFSSLTKIMTIEPNYKSLNKMDDLYQDWKQYLKI